MVAPKKVKKKSRHKQINTMAGIIKELSFQWRNIQ